MAGFEDDAAAAGCRCGIPIECSGICPPGDELLNAGENVKIGNEENLCGIFNLRAQGTIDAEVCTQWQVDAAAAGWQTPQMEEDQELFKLELEKEKVLICKRELDRMEAANKLRSLTPTLLQHRTSPRPKQSAKHNEHNL